MAKKKAKKNAAPKPWSDFVRGRRGPGVGYKKRKFPPGIDRDTDGVVKERKPKAGYRYKTATKADQNHSRKVHAANRRKR